MKKNTSLMIFFFLFFLSLWADKREINSSWKFHLGDLPSAKSLQFDDTSWRILNLPHDWAFENGYSRDGAQKDKGGYACGGIGWYRKVLEFSPEELNAKNVFLDFDAVYMNSEVWINEHYLGRCSYGYRSFSYDVTPYVHVGKNLVSVRVDNSLEPSARWYHGCGIYGNVYVRNLSDLYFVKDGTFVYESSASGTLMLRSLIHRKTSSAAFRWKAELWDEQGSKIQHLEGCAGETSSDTLDLKMNICRPHLWSPEQPYLYTLRLQMLSAQNEVLDEQYLSIGFRDMRWSVENGFYLNGKQYKLHGVCEHLEGGPTGAIYTKELMRWKLQLLKDMGCNAIRTAHNPQLPFFYDLCDEMGFLVMDEIFDGWKRKADYDYGMQSFSENWEKDVRAVIRRDRNHPSIFLYSVGNETRGPMAADLVRVCKEEDPTRKVTSGTAGSEEMEILGVNGRSEAKKFLETFKPTDKPFIGTENPHTWQVRGYYRTQTWYRDGYHPTGGQMMEIPNLTEKEIFTYDWVSPQKRGNRKQVFNSSYDNATVRVTARHILAALRENNWFSGSFRWTGFDYLGEAGYVHGGWPFRAFQSGALDLAGFPKDLYYLYQSEWTNMDMVHILPHWTHPYMKEGTLIPVWVYTTGDEVELFFNGKSYGRCPKGSKWNEIQCQFMVPWKPGKLEAVAYRKGKEIARDLQVSAGAPSRLGIEVENEHLKSDGKDISIVTLKQEDCEGVLYPYGENRVHVKIEGDARILSFENGSPIDTTCNFGAVSRCCFFGLNRLFVQSTGGNENEPVELLVAVIHGDKRLKLSNKVSISLDRIPLRGDLSESDLKIFYTTDGSIPSTQSALYTSPFVITPGTSVKAAVYKGNCQVLSMEEKFGPQEGLYWGKCGEKESADVAEQAELLQLENCKVVQGGTDVHGTGYVLPSPGNGILSWYQENDGGQQQGKLTIRYSQSYGANVTRMALYNNNKLLKKVEFTNTGSVDSNWRIISVPLMIHPGANQLSLRSISKGVPSIDQIKIE